MIGCERAIGKKKKKLDTEQTHLRHTPHMTPTPKDPDSFAGWSDADVLQVSCGTHHFHKWASVVFLAR